MNQSILNSFQWSSRLNWIRNLLNCSQYCAKDCKSLYGLLGYLKPEPPKDDLRLSNPFEQLKTFVNQFDLEKLDNLEHSHVPYVVTLMKMNQLWKDAHDGKTSATFQEKEEYKLLIMKNARGEWGHEQNFAEAPEHGFLLWDVEKRKSEFILSFRINFLYIGII